MLAYDSAMPTRQPSTIDPAAPVSAIVVACLAATWFIWGSTYLAIKWALTSLPPLFQMGTRFIAAGLLVGAWARWRGAPWPSRGEWINATWLGALMLGGGYGGTALAEVTVGSGLVVAFIAVTPALVAIAQWPYGVRPTALECAGIALGLAGVLLLVRGQGFAASPAGLAAMVLACTTWALGSVWSLRGLPGGRDLALAPGAAGYSSQMLVGGAMLLLASVAAGEQPRWPPDPRALACWAYLVVAGSLLGFLAYMELLRRASMMLASSYTFVNPVIALLLGVGLGGERVSPLEWSAAGVVLVGVVMLLLGRGR